MSYQFQLFADYFQIYLFDDAPSRPDVLWSSDEIDALIADFIQAAPGVLCFQTARNTTVPVTLEVEEGPPGDPLCGWDHVAEASLEVSSGRVVIQGCSDNFPEAPRIRVRPQVYRVRINYGGLENLSDDRLKGDDHYRVVLWPGAAGPPRVLKRYRGPTPN